MRFQVRGTRAWEKESQTRWYLVATTASKVQKFSEIYIQTQTIVQYLSSGVLHFQEFSMLHLFRASIVA